MSLLTFSFVLKRYKHSLIISFCIRMKYGYLCTKLQHSKGHGRLQRVYEEDTPWELVIAFTKELVFISTLLKTTREMKYFYTHQLLKRLSWPTQQLFYLLTYVARYNLSILHSTCRMWCQKVHIPSVFTSDLLTCTFAVIQCTLHIWLLAYMLSLNVTSHPFYKLLCGLIKSNVGNINF